MYHILMVDDERLTLQLRSNFLKKKGCTVDSVTTAEEAIELVSASTYDCILLDVMLVESSGFALCKKLQALTNTPIIFLSSLTDEESQLEGFVSGGTDYITKCAGLPLFWAKIETRIKLSGTETQYINYAPLTINLSARKAYISDNDILLTSLEFDILVLLARKPERVFSLSEIYIEVWGTEQWDQGQTVQVHVSHMRRKLEKAFPRHYFIETVWGKGYQFIPAKF